MNNSNNTTDPLLFQEVPLPTPFISDYIRAAMNALCFLLGLPINLLTFFRQLRRSRGRRSKQKINILHINLNISDLMILIFYSFGQVCWLITWEWLGGDLGCRIMRFLESVAFSFSSNVIVCIALNRLRAMIHPLQACTYEASLYTKRSLYVAWVLAFVTSSPQLATYEVLVMPGTDGWTQCVSIWFAAEIFNSTSSIHQFWQRFYSIYHLLVMFWIPLVCLSFCYALILREICPEFQIDRCFRTSPRIQEPQDLSNFASHGRGGSTTTAASSPIDELEDLKGPNINILTAKISTPRNMRAGSHCSMTESHAGAVTLRLVSGQDARQKSRIKMIRVTLILLTLYIVFWLPYNVISLWTVVDFDSFKPFQNQIYILLSLELVVVNSVVNPWVYGTFKLNDFRCREAETVNKKHLVVTNKRSSFVPERQSLTAGKDSVKFRCEIGSVV